MVGQIGRVVGGRYRLLAPLGLGASADVFLADDVTLRRRVAVKVLHAALAGDESFLKRFRAEAQTVAGLRHPNIMAVYDWGEEADGPYLVLEYLGGGSLRDLLDRGHRLSPSQGLLVGLEAARALDYAHRRGLVHRDIKPANLLFDDEGRLCVADFGIARALAEATWTEPSGAVVGTVRYASPEQARGNSVDGKADVYALVLVILESITGTVPFSADTTIATLMARLDRPIPVPEDLGPFGDALRSAGTLEAAERVDAARLVTALDRAARRLPRPEPLPVQPDQTVDLTLAVKDPTVLGASGSPAPAPAEAGAGGSVFDASADPELARELGYAPGAPLPPAVADWLDSEASVSSVDVPTTSGVLSRRRRWPRVAAIVAAALVLGAGLAYGAVRMFTPTYAVPAVTTLSSGPLPHQFRVRVIHTRRDGTKAGQILLDAQHPGAGARRPTGSSIDVVVSDGQTLVSVPDLTQLDQPSAQARLAAAGLVAGSLTQQYSDTVTAGVVISWTGAGSSLAKGTPVDLVVSKGKTPIPVPDVRLMTLTDAQAKLAAAGLTAVTSDQVFDDTVPADQVVGTDPPAGGDGRGQTIVVHVSKGPQIVTVPDVTGQTVAQATATLNAAGLQVGNIYGPAKGKRVLDTGPGPDSRVPHGTAVDLYTAR